MPNVPYQPPKRKLLQSIGLFVLGLLGTVIMTILGIAITAYVEWHLEH